jgi:hypothetical protein
VFRAQNAQIACGKTEHRTQNLLNCILKNHVQSWHRVQFCSTDWQKYTQNRVRRLTWLAALVVIACIFACGLRAPFQFGSMLQVLGGGGGGAMEGPRRSKEDSKIVSHVWEIQEWVVRKFQVGKSRCQKDVADPSSSWSPCMVAHRGDQ